MTKVNVVGAGLAGSECAWQLAMRGIDVEIFEMRSEERKTFAHRTKNFAELVCSNSLRSDDVNTAIGLLHEEMRYLNSLTMLAADKNKIPAGSALAVDREGFSQFIENALLQTKKVKINRSEISELPVSSNEFWVIATGPLTSDALSKSILKYSGEEHLAFFDAIAPIVFKDSIDLTKAWFQSRYDKGSGNDYINCPLNRDQYYEFVDDLKKSEKTEFKDWEKNTPYFDGCLPIEIMAERGIETLRYGPMKPTGLTNSHFPISPLGTLRSQRKEKPYAVVQLRQDNALGTIYNMVGFQTKMKYGEQQKIFRKIPGLENAEFARFGGIHRNTFINSPKLLDEFLRFKTFPHIRFAGQITGVEGYVESASMGLLAGIFLAHEIISINNNQEKLLKDKNSFAENFQPSNKTAIGALLSHITQNISSLDLQQKERENNFQPMNVNFGLFLPLEEKINKQNRKEAYSIRALDELKKWKESYKI